MSTASDRSSSAGIAGLGFAAMQVAGSAGRGGAGSLTDRPMVWRGWSQARAAAAVLAGQALAGAALLAGLIFVADGLVVLALLVGVGVTIVGFTGSTTPASRRSWTREKSARPPPAARRP